MPEFATNVPIETAEPRIEVTNALKPGRHRFRLVVVDDSGNESQPDLVDIIVLDRGAPTAVLDAPREVPFGQRFNLSGERSTDAGGGAIVRYIWTLLPGAIPDDDILRPPGGIPDGGILRPTGPILRRPPPIQ